MRISLRSFPIHAGPCTLAVALALAGCASAPRHEAPAVVVPAAWKEAPTAPGWVPASPGDLAERGAWWAAFSDPLLDTLAERVQIDNQTIALAAANYAQAQALVRQQQAALLPALGLSGSVRRSGTRQTNPATSAAASLEASWSPDLWGRVGLAVQASQATAQASEADLAAARLSTIGALAGNYFSLRGADAELRLLEETIRGYERSVEITSNRYEAGIAAQTDLLQARTQLVNARAEQAALQRARAALEHAIAVLVGVAPASFDIAPVANWQPAIPVVPISLPSTLLERRPDIAAAERAVAAANAQIGVARSAYFPSLGLSASLGGAGSRVGDLFNTSNLLWSFGLSVAQTLFDGGAIAARIDATRAAHDATVAQYRQTVLAAFQEVEDQLSAARSLAQQAALREEASAAADRTEQQLLNRYRAGQVNYTEVVTAQASALSARRLLIQARTSRQLAAVALMQSLGGGWRAV